MRKLIRVIVLAISFGAILGFTLTEPSALAEDIWSTGWEGGDATADDPLSWNQCRWSYSSDYYVPWGLSWCEASCGAHAMAWVGLKTGLLKQGDHPMTVWEQAEADPSIRWLYAWSKGIDFFTNPNPKVEGKQVKMVDFYEGSFDDARAWVVDRYEKGYYQILNPSGHYGALDYIDKNGNILVLDSAGARCKYFECLASNWNMHVVRAAAIEVEGAAPANSPDAINLWDGDAAVSGDRTNDSSGGNNSGANAWNLEQFDPFEPIDNPIVQYEEHIDRGAEDEHKGVQKQNVPWWQQLLGQ